MSLYSTILLSIFLLFSISTIAQSNQNEGFAKDLALANIEPENINNQQIEQATFWKAMKKSGLSATIKKSGPFTLFIPLDSYNTSFDLEENNSNLYSMLTYHMVAGKITASKILQAINRSNGLASFTTVQGTKIKAFLKGLDIIIIDALGNKAKILYADQSQNKGIAHVIEATMCLK